MENWRVLRAMAEVSGSKPHCQASSPPHVLELALSILGRFQQFIFLE